MRYALISDIHGNIQALDSVLDRIGQLGADGTVCLGDIVGYGARPNECIARIRESCREVLLGNHDAGAIGKTSLDDFNPVARLAIEWTKGVLGRKEVVYLDTLPYCSQGENLAVTHATLSRPEAWNYIFSPRDAAMEFDAIEEDLLFCGHTHYPVIFTLGEGQVMSFRDTQMAMNSGYRYIANVGSVGQPRDGNPAACFLVYDTEKREIEYQRVPYDIEGTQRDILATTIPKELALRLSIGR